MTTHTPLGSQTKSKQHGSVGPAAVYPAHADSGSGSSLICSDGSHVIDLIAGLGAISLGYQDSGVIDAVSQSLRRGSILSLPHKLENEVATLLSEVIPCAEMTRFVMTGSEAVQGAVQIARAVTGKSSVVVAAQSYHGWHEWCQAPFRQQGPFGPTEYYGKIAGHLSSFQDNDSAALGATLHAFDHPVPNSVAAIVIEPYRFPLADTLEQTRAAQRKFHAEARRLAVQHGALLIFDEMIFGFRHALGGSQELWCDSDTMPDIACFGKALGNGVPIAAICGIREVMQEAHLVSSTFGGSLLGLAAAKEVITRYRTENISERMWETGHILREGFSFEAEGSPARLEGYPVHFRLAGLTDKQRDEVLASAFSRGVLLHRACGNIIAAMSHQDALHAGTVLGGAVQSVCDSVADT
jgi:glutamate-1-semialdehyde 2,1-aminomutase